MLRFILLALCLFRLPVSASPQTYTKIVQCLSASNIPQAYPGTPSFTELIIPLNLRLNYTPIALALPTTVPQVQAAVKCAVKLGVKVNPRSGGHSYASHSIGGEDGHLVVDLRYFRETVVDRKTNVAAVGPGARLGNVAVALFEQGERAMAHGVCPGVGVGGHVLHGGQGYSTHTHGLLLDFLLSAEVVLADGSLVTASTTQNSELFWALRGAGMSFGIVTSFKFRTIAAPPENILFYYPYLWDQAQARAGWEAWQQYCGGFTEPIIPREMNIRWVVVNADSEHMIFLLEGAFHGSEADFLVAIAPLLSALEKVGGLQADIRGTGPHSLGWLDSLLYANNNDLFNEQGTGETLESPLNYTAHSTFFTKSLMTDNLSTAGIDAFINQLYTTGPTSPVGWYFIIYTQGGPTSILTQPPFSSPSTSYAHRTSLYEWQLVAQVAAPPFPSIGIDWLNAFVDAILDVEERSGEKKKVLGMYYNYADPSLGGREAGERYWLQNYPRLQAIKKKVDPRSVFMNPQTV
ncbi:hypothetical protein BKA64DRAFT_477161 [Cadophora sp. MPI-SDFR-AT-0126]|nr:hypothetical protein BKA64DRAFT_477161 [Leotiomycetes sp. MPI-SDFR-AT-0126]